MRSPRPLADSGNAARGQPVVGKRVESETGRPNVRPAFRSPRAGRWQLRAADGAGDAGKVMHARGGAHSHFSTWPVTIFQKPSVVRQFLRKLSSFGCNSSHHWSSFGAVISDQSSRTTMGYPRSLRSL